MTLEKRIAVYPGSFDPVTLGHEDIARRALSLADHLIVAVSHNASHSKSRMFSVAERIAMIEEVFENDRRIEVAEFDGLLVDFARRRGAGIVVRGLRGVADFEYEFQMALTNRALDPTLETIFLAPDPARSFLSASLVREVSSLGGDVSSFVSAGVLTRLRARETA